MNKHLSYLLIILLCSGCSVVCKQYYYVPAATHLTTKKQVGYSKMIYSQVEIPDSSGKNIASMTTSNGIGIPLFVGPPYLPVVPVGIVSAFSKKLRQFEIDITVKPDDGYFMALAIDSNRYKMINDSLRVLKIATAADLHTGQCYMIANGSKRIPLRVTEYFMGTGASHSYRMSAPVGFGKVHRMTIATGNTLLDDHLKNLVFTRKKRVIHFIIGPG